MMNVSLASSLLPIRGYFLVTLAESKYTTHQTIRNHGQTKNKASWDHLKTQQLNATSDESLSCINIKHGTYIEGIQFVTNKRSSPFIAGKVNVLNSSIESFHLTGDLARIDVNIGGWMDSIKFYCRKGFHQEIQRSLQGPLDIDTSDGYRSKNGDKLMNSFINFISCGNPVNRISIRILGSVGIKWNGDKFDINLGKGKICHVFYQENDKNRPTVFNIEYTPKIESEIARVVQVCKQSGNYMVNNNKKYPYCLFYQGHINSSYESVNKLYSESFKNGNMQLFKCDYTKAQDWYKIRCHIGGKIYSCKYIFDDFQIVDRDLHHKKNQDQELFLGETCSLCLVYEPSYCLVPCGHLCICDNCVMEPSLISCPICQKVFTSKQKIIEINEHYYKHEVAHNHQYFHILQDTVLLISNCFLSKDSLIPYS